jgi:fructan beta-fructosidase
VSGARAGWRETARALASRPVGRGAYRIVATVSAAIAAGACAAPASVPVSHPGDARAEPTWTERYRPRYHFTPAMNWMNDPNGLVFFDDEYHLFYQHNPFGITWGHMSWGHAVSPDLVHWEHLPVAIPEEDGVMAFSGSAVVDWRNTSGFGGGGRSPLVAVYTGHREGHQSQYLAYSRDRGRTWTTYEGNPVLDRGMADFRDPKVFWYEPERRWIMVVALPQEYRISFYASPDLKQWTHLSDFGPAGATGGIWECPDLFELPVDGDSADTRWVLIVNLNPGAVAGGSGTQYFVGRFDGTTFVPDPPPTGAAGGGESAVLWADYGQDFYAAVSWSDIPPEDGRRVWIGWMNNWLYGQDIPTTPWRSAQSLPRALALRSTPAGIRLVQEPVEELRGLRGRRRTVPPQAIREGSLSLAPHGVRGAALELIAELDAGTAAEVGLRVRTAPGEETLIGVDVASHTLFVDRTRSGDTGFHPDFGGRQTAPLPLAEGRVRLHVFLDASSVEVFAAGGLTVITDQVFPSPTSDGVELYARGGTARLLSLEAWPLRSVRAVEPAGSGGGR